VKYPIWYRLDADGTITPVKVWRVNRVSIVLLAGRQMDRIPKIAERVSYFATRAEAENERKLRRFDPSN
jgi:hypothetical protein